MYVQVGGPNSGTQLGARTAGLQRLLLVTYTEWGVLCLGNDQRIRCKRRRASDVNRASACRTGYQSCSSMARIQTSGTVRYTEFSPTGSETSGTDGRSEIVAAIDGPTCCSLKAKKFNHFSRARVRVCAWRPSRPACYHFRKEPDSA